VREVFSGTIWRAGSKTKSSATLSFLFLDAGRFAQGAGSLSRHIARGGSARCARGTAQRTVLAVPRGALALLGSNEHDVAPAAASQIERLDPVQLAIWISAAPDPQRSALALFYLDQFDYREILDLAELKLSELSRLLARGRRQLQAWLDAKFPQPGHL
jgi:hypothetical protein